jgi:sn-glycerol 3-phosphate transport system substrate-binding protein
MRACHSLLYALLLTPVMGLASTNPEPVEFWYGHSGQAGLAIRQLCDEFNASHRDMRPLRCIAQGTYEQTLQKTVAAYRSGKSPALVEIYDVATLEMLLSGAILPVAQVMSDHGEPQGDEFLPAVRRYYASHDGPLAAQPFALSTAVLYSHRAPLRAAGINEPPATWEAFGAALKALREHGNTCPTVTDFNPWIWLEQSSAVMGVPVATENNGANGTAARYVFDQGPHAQLLKDLRRWVADGSVIDQSATRSGRQELAFASGDCAMLLGSTGASNLIASGQNSDVTVTPLPVYARQNRHPTVAGGAALWVLRGQSDDAYATVAAFLAYLRQPAVQLKFSRATGYLPVTQTPATEVIEQLPRDSAVTVGLHSLSDPGGHSSAPLRTGCITLLRLLWTQELHNALTGGETANVALQQAVGRGNVLLSTFEETYRNAWQP